MTKNKVLILKSNFHKSGGLEKYAWRSALAFANRDCSVDILTTGQGQKHPYHPRISFITVRTSTWPSFVQLEQFDYFCKLWQQKHKVPTVFGLDRNRLQTHIRAGNGVHAAYLDSRTLAEGKCKRFACYINPLHRTILKLEKDAFENPSLKKLITNSHMVKNEVLKYYKTDPNKIKVIHNGVEWQEMEQDFSIWEEKRKEFLQKLNLSTDNFYFLFVGNGYLRKGLKVLLSALSKIKQMPFHLLVIGKDNKTEFFKDLTQNLGLKEKVSFLGQVNNMRPFYQLADTLVIPSFYDPFANVTLEALAMGLRVISSKSNGGHEILNPHASSIVEDLLNTDEMVAALTSALSYPKNSERALFIRQSVQHLDFSKQMNLLLDEVLSDV